MRSTILTLSAVVALVLSGPVQAKNLAKEKGPKLDPATTWRWPVAVAPLMEKAPVIDGTLDAREWSAATRLAPMMDYTTGVAVADETVVYVGYTAERLYIGFRFMRSPAAPPPMAVSTVRDRGVWREDNVELFLQSEVGAKNAFNFAGNAASTFGDGITGIATDKSWNAAWEYKSRMVPGGWEGEAAIAFSELKSETPAVGAVWGFSIFRNERTPTTRLADWCHMFTWNDKNDYGYLVFGGRTPAAQIARAGELNAKEIGCEVDLNNATGEASRITVSCELLQAKDKDRPYFKTLEGEADVFGAATDAKNAAKIVDVAARAMKGYTPVLSDKRTVDLAPGAKMSVPFAVAAGTGSYVLRYTATLADGRLLAGGVLPFVKRHPLELTYEPYFLTSETIHVTADLVRVAGITAGSKVMFEVRDAAGAVAVQATAAIGPGQDTVSVDLSTAGMKPGAYAIQAKAVSGEGAELAASRLPLERPAAPEWHANRLGHPRAVPPPWTPVQAGDAGYGVWGRTVRFGPDLMPASIVSREKDLLASPISLRFGDGANGWTTQRMARERSDALRAHYSFQGTRGTLEVRIAAEAEFDGFLRYDVTLTPKGKTTLNELVLEIPLCATEATQFGAHLLTTPPHWEAAPRGPVGPMPAEDVSMPFTDFIWIGNDVRGLQWFCETDEAWRPRDRKAAVQIKRAGDVTTLQIDFIGVPAEISKPVTLTWALMPTPVKPMDEKLNHETMICQSGFPKFGPAMDEEWAKQVKAHKDIGADAVICWSDAQQVWNPDFGNPCMYDAGRIAAMRRMVDYAHSKGLKVLAYAIWGGMPQNRPEWKDFGVEMSRHPLSLGVGDNMLYCPVKSFNDWYIWSLAKTIRETGIDGVYLDSSPAPFSCVNASHGCGYRDAEGQIHGTYPIFGNRELHKRIYTLFHGELQKDGIVYAHHSGVPNLACEPFVDVHHTAEGASLDRTSWLVRYYGVPYGLPVTFTYWNMPHYPMKRTNAWGVALLLDAQLKVTVSMWPPYTSWLPKNDYSPNALFDSKVWELKRKFPWAGAEWWPYWKNRDYVTPGNDATLVSFHLQREREVFLTALNTQDKEADTTLKINLAAMGLAAGRVAVRDVVTGGAEKIGEDGALTLRFLPKSPRILHITALAGQP